VRALIAEDDYETGQYLRTSFAAEGIDSDLVEDGRSAVSRGLSETYDILILDRMLQGLDGLAALRALRAAHVKTPAILLTAMGSVDDRVAGLRAGADDYIVKPFAFVELMARIDTILRRPGSSNGSTELMVGEIRLNLVARTALRSGCTIDLQNREFLLLKHFMERPGRVQTRTILLEAVWGLRFDPKTSVVETHMSRLRNKIDKPFDRPHLVTLPGVGYVFQP